MTCTYDVETIWKSAIEQRIVILDSVHIDLLRLLDYLFALYKNTTPQLLGYVTVEREKNREKYNIRWSHQDAKLDAETLRYLMLFIGHVAADRWAMRKFYSRVFSNELVQVTNCIEN